MSRVAVTGFDLGAQTAMALVGEAIDGIQPQAFADAIQCVIALSPYADFSDMGAASRFRSIHAPVLSITGADDLDPYGLTGSAAVRRVPYQYMPAGKKYLLLLASAPHSLLAGKGLFKAETPRSTRSSLNTESDKSGSDGDQGTNRKARKGRGSHKRDPSSASLPEENTMLSSRLAITNIEQLSTAYLDATLKNDSVAWEWLSKDAARWLGEATTLSAK